MGTFPKLVVGGSGLAAAAGAIGLGVVVPNSGMGLATGMTVSGECTELDLEVTSLGGGATEAGLGA